MSKKLIIFLCNLKISGNQYLSFAWNGWTDKNQEGIWTSSLNESVTLGSNYRPWYEGKPDGGTIKNCGVVLGEANSWSDEDCSHESCTICDIPAKKALIMRGKIKFPSNQIKISNFFKANFFLQTRTL